MADFFVVSLVSDKIEGEVLDEFHINDEQFVIKIKNRL